MPSFSREIIKCLCPKEVPCPFFVPHFSLNDICPRDCPFWAFLQHLTQCCLPLHSCCLILYSSALLQGMSLHCYGTRHLGFLLWPHPEIIFSKKMPFPHSLLQKMQLTPGSHNTPLAPLCLSFSPSFNEFCLNWMPSLTGDIISTWALSLAGSQVVSAMPVG
jgi:hypothetical protein